MSDAEFESQQEWNCLSEDTKKLARQIIKLFSENQLTICHAKEVFRACEIYMDVNGKVNVAN
jgi:hypothetical protein